MTITRITAVLLLAACAARGQLAHRWLAEATRTAPQEIAVYRGETLALEPTVTVHGEAYAWPQDTAVTLWWQTNGMGSAWWSAPAALGAETGALRAVWSPACDAGADRYTFFIRAAAPSGTAYRASGTLRMLASPGAVPNALPLPVPVLDFSGISVLNPPWPSAADWASGSNALASALQAHAQRTDNPHATSPQQIGAATPAAVTSIVSDAIAALPPPSADARRLINDNDTEWIDATGAVWRVTQIAVTNDAQRIMWDSGLHPEFGLLTLDLIAPNQWRVDLDNNLYAYFGDIYQDEIAHYVAVGQTDEWPYGLSFYQTDHPWLDTFPKTYLRGDGHTGWVDRVVSYQTVTTRVDTVALISDLTAIHSALTNAIGAGTSLPRLLLFDATAVVGDALQIFTRAVVEANDPYALPHAFASVAGYSFPRFYEYTPTATGDVAMTASIRTMDGSANATASAMITAVSAGQTPTSNINVLCVGDSLTANGYWPAELRRRLCGSGGDPAASAFSNITFIGDAAALTAGDTNTLFTGHGGFTYPIYTGDALATYGHVLRGSFDKDRRDVTSTWTNAAGASFEIEYVSTNVAVRDVTENGGLEYAHGGAFGDPWSAIGTAAIDHSVVLAGTNSACVTGGAGTYLDPSVNYDANLVSGTYKLSFFAAGESAGGYYSVLVNGSSYAIPWTGTGALSESWKKVEATFVLTEAANVKVYLNNPNAAGTKIYYDDLSLIWTDPAITNAIKIHGYNLAPTGTLFHSYGATNTSPIVYSSSTSEPASPFWLTESNRFSFADWAARNGFSGIDACYVMLGWNSLAVGKSAADHAAEIIYSAKFIDRLHADYPACQVRVMGQQIPSPNGGLGTSYGATGLYAMSADYFQAVQAMNGLRLAYRDMCAARAGWCRYIDVASQFDSEYNMPVGSYPVNTRNSTTETRGVNGVHPALSGYFQIADAAWRDFVRTFCQ